MNKINWNKPIVLRMFKEGVMEKDAPVTKVYTSEIRLGFNHLCVAAHPYDKEQAFWVDDYGNSWCIKRAIVNKRSRKKL